MVLRRASCIVFGILLSACSANVVDDSPREYSGVWLYEFESSVFLLGATEVPKKRPYHEDSSWLDYHPGQQYSEQRVDISKYDEFDEENNCYPVRAFSVNFIGRKTTDPHGSGHMGLWASGFAVEKMISLKPLGPPFCYGNKHSDRISKTPKTAA